MFVAGTGVSINDIAEKLQVSVDEVKAAVYVLQKKYNEDSGIQIITFKDKIQFR